MARLWRPRFRRVLIDVDTQYDLLFGNGIDRSEMLRRIRRLMAWARVHHVTVISTALAQRGRSSAEAGGVESVCVEGTAGQRKIGYTVLHSSIQFGAENRLDLPRHLLTDYQQVIFEKRTADPFSQPRADRLLTEMKADEFIVFGMGVEKAVKATVLGLLCRRKKVLVVEDAIDGQDRHEAMMAVRHMEAKGAKLVTTDWLTGPSKLAGVVRLGKGKMAGLASSARVR